MADEFEIGGHAYRAGKMPLMEKFHVSRRLAPVLAGMVKTGEVEAGGTGAMAAIADAVAKMPQEDADYVVSQCLAAAEIRQGDRWTAVSRNGRVMFDFIDLPDMMRIVMGVLTENLGAFFPGTLSVSTAAVPTPPTSSSSVSQTA